MIKLHKDSFVLDSHCDTPSMLLEGINISKRSGRTQVDIEKMIEGGIDAIFFAIYSPASLSADESTVYALSQISKCYDAVDQNKNRIAFAFSPEDAVENKKKGVISIFLGMENGSPIQENLSLLGLFRRLGIRYMTLCHSKHNDICDSCTPVKPRWGGLSPFGKELVEELNRTGIMIDCSHASDATFYDLLKHSKAPVVATHSCCRALCNHPRNLTDDMIKDLASLGGVIQVNFYPVFLNNDFGDDEYVRLSEEGEKWQNLYRSDLHNLVYRENYFNIQRQLNRYPSVSYKRIIDHIDHIVELVGAEHVGLGSDFDGINIAPEGLRDISGYPNITTELLARGYSESDIRAILGENFLRVMREVQKRASI